MTTINNLIDQVGGIEKARGIVSGAPNGAHLWRDMDSVCTPNEILYYAWFGGALLVFEDGKGWVKSIYHGDNEYILDQLQDLNDLRTAIAQHDMHWYGRSEEDEIKSYAELSQEKIECGAGLKGNFSDAVNRAEQLIDQHQEFKVGDFVVLISGSDNDVFEYVEYSKGLDLHFFESKNNYGHSKLSNVRHATPAEIKAGHRIDDTTDHVADIRNHLSPSTIVKDLEAERHG